MLGATDQLLIELPTQPTLTFQKLDQDFVIDNVAWEELLHGEGALVGSWRGCDLAIFEGVF